MPHFVSFLPVIGLPSHFSYSQNKQATYCCQNRKQKQCRGPCTLNLSPLIVLFWVRVSLLAHTGLELSVFQSQPSEYRCVLCTPPPPPSLLSSSSWVKNFCKIALRGGLEIAVNKVFVAQTLAKSPEPKSDDPSSREAETAVVKA